MKIIYLWAIGNPVDHLYISKEISSWNNYDITMVDFEHHLGVSKLSWKELDNFYKNHHEKLLRFYDYILELSKIHDILIVNYSNPLHPEFLKSLKGKIYTVLHSGDDPQGSSNCSQPYVRYFDYSFCYGMIFDENTTIIEKFKECGSNRTDRWVYGFRNDMYNHHLTEDDIYTKERDIDVIFAGSPWHKEDDLASIKNEIPQAKIYGREYFGIMAGHIYRKLKRLELPNIGMIKLIFAKELPQEKYIEYLNRSKIGINIHLDNLSGGNLRTIQLPANGVMQISGCEDGVKDVFKVGEEIICYRNTDEAIDLIKYYLAHNDERKKIALAGFRRTIKDYKYKTTFQKSLEKIKQGMLEDGILYCKDGAPIIVDEK